MFKKIAMSYTANERAIEVADAVAVEHSKMSHELEVAHTAYAESKRALEKTQDELQSTRKKVRDQSEADMVLVSIKLIAGALKGESKESLAPLYNQQSAYAAQMQNVSSNPIYQGYGQYASAFGNLGLAGLLR